MICYYSVLVPTRADSCNDILFVVLQMYVGMPPSAFHKTLCLHMGYMSGSYDNIISRYAPVSQTCFQCHMLLLSRQRLFAGHFGIVESVRWHSPFLHWYGRKVICTFPS